MQNYKKINYNMIVFKIKILNRNYYYQGNKENNYK